jgi:hypothetical protein
LAALLLPVCQARFTFLYKEVNGQWRIAEHHSSAMPEVTPAGVAEMFDRWNTALQVRHCASLRQSLPAELQSKHMHRPLL